MFTDYGFVVILYYVHLKVLLKTHRQPEAVRWKLQDPEAPRAALRNQQGVQLDQTHSDGWKAVLQPTNSIITPPQNKHKTKFISLVCFTEVCPSFGWIYAFSVPDQEEKQTATVQNHQQKNTHTHVLLVRVGSGWKTCSICGIFWQDAESKCWFCFSANSKQLTANVSASLTFTSFPHNFSFLHISDLFFFRQVCF